MSEDRTAVTEAVNEILSDRCTIDRVTQAEPEGWNAELWSVLSESGYALVSVPEDFGGSGGDVADACAVLEAVGRFAAAVPVAESSLLGGWALASAGIEVPAVVLTAPTGHRDDVARLEQTGSGWRLTGRWHRVPWACQAEYLVVVTEGEDELHVAMASTAGLTIEPGANLAGESRDLVIADSVVVDVCAPAPPEVTPSALRLRGALARSASMAGALLRVAELTNRYTTERHQFGRAIGRFQAVQRHVVRVSERAHMAAIAADCAAANASPEPNLFDVASAKIVAGESATTAAQAAHQAHGAIGMTKEYALGHFTPRLWSWRQEFGSEKWWSLRVGRALAAQGPNALYPRISLGRTDQITTVKGAA